MACTESSCFNFFRVDLLSRLSALHYWHTINSKFESLTSSTLHLVNKSGVAEQTLPGGALPYKPIRDVPFFRVSFFTINS